MASGVAGVGLIEEALSMTQSLLPWVRRPAGLGVLLGLLGWACGSSLPAGADTNPPGIGGSGLGDAETGALLAAYFQRLLDDRDLAAFHDRVRRGTPRERWGASSRNPPSPWRAARPSSRWGSR